MNIALAKKAYRDRYGITNVRVKNNRLVGRFGSEWAELAHLGDMDVFITPQGARQVRNRGEIVYAYPPNEKYAYTPAGELQHHVALRSPTPPYGEY